jgi:predicted PurR-regulated permease PerM
MKNKIEISTNTLLKITGIILILWFIFLMKEVLLMLFISIILVSALEPLVTKLEFKKMPRVLSGILIYLVFFSFVGFCFYLIIPVLIFEVKQLGENLPEYFSGVNNFLVNFNNSVVETNFQIDVKGLVNNISSRITEFVSQIFSNSFNFLTILFKTFIVFALAFYMMVKRDGINGFWKFLLPQKYEKYAINLTKKIQKKMGSWLIGQLTIAFLVFILEFVILYLLGVPYALLIAMLGGFLNLIPFIGPFMAFIPTVLVALLVSPITAVLVGVLYVVIQQIESYVFVPLIMKRAIGLDPVVIIIALIVGASLFGFLGMLIAIPFTGALTVFIKEFQEKGLPE